MEPSSGTILERLQKLSEAISSCGLDDDGTGNTRLLLAQEGMLDALLVLYDECNDNTLKKDPHIQGFVDKYKGAIQELRHLRVNVNDFEQKKVIGKGHFGIVQVVREKQTGNVYALKTLRKSETLAHQHIACYEEERDIMAKATSPWITHLQYAFQDDLHLYLLMDFHPGGDLLSLLDRFDYSFNEEMVRFYLAEITVAVHAVHSMNYAHRDIKPDNVLLDRCGHIKLADFGSAAKLSSSGKVQSKMAVGTPDYVAPEVLESVKESVGKERGYGVECDFWSIGIMAYEMLFGETPFKREKSVETYSCIINHKENLKFPSEVQDVSSLAKDLIKGLLEKADRRINYNTMVKHRFFLQTDWNSLESVRPPFIPVVTSVDDTSNFEEFDNEIPLPDIGAFISRQPFSGRQLPFVGFTYTRPVTESDLVGKCASSSEAIAHQSNLDCSKDTSSMEIELKVKNRELFDANLTISKLSECEPSKQPRQTEKRAIQAETRLRLLEKERQRLEEEFRKREGLVQKLKQDLTMEKSERAKTESRTLDFLRDIKKKWKLEEEQKMANLTKKIELHQNVILKLNSAKEEGDEKWREATMEVNQCKADIYKLRRLLKEKDDKLAKLSVEPTGNSSCNEQCLKATEWREKFKQISAEHVNCRTEIQESNRSNETLLRKLCDLKRKGDLMSNVENTNAVLEEEVSKLQDQLIRSRKETTSIQNQLKEVREKVLHAQEDQMRKMEANLRQGKQDCQHLKERLQDVSSKLNESIASQNSRDLSFLDQQDQMELRYKEMESELIEVSKEKTQLTSELSRVSAREGEQLRKISELEALMSSLREALSNLESKQSTGHSKQKLEAQLELLQKQLEASQAEAATDKENLHLVEENLRKKEREFTDLRLDNRSNLRDLKSAKESNQYLRDKHREMKEQISAKESEITNIVKKEKSLEKEIKNLQEEKENLQKEHSFSLSSKQKEIEVISDKISEKDRIIDSIEKTRQDLRSSQREADKLRVEKISLEKEIQILERTKEGRSQAEKQMKENNIKLEDKIEEHELIIEQLKEVCSEQDEQLNALDQFKDKIAQMNEEKEQLSDKVQQLQTELKGARIATNEEKSLKLFQEKLVKSLEEKVSSLDEEHDQYIENLQQQMDGYISGDMHLNAQVAELEKNISESAMREGTLNHEVLSLQDQLELAKSEASGHVELIHNLKNSNFKLTEGLEEAVTKGEGLKRRLEETNRSMKQTNTSFADKELRMNSVIAQQTKLIDFLQAKTEHPPKKKTPLSRLFGNGREKETTAGGFMVAHQYRELEDLLAIERTHVKQLSQQLSKAHAEVVALKAQANTKDIARTPVPTRVPKTPLVNLTNSPDVHSRSSKCRMRHKVPHRWQSHLVMRVCKCTGCLESIPFSRRAVKCMECGVIAHTKCSSGIANTCGLPKALAHQYIEAMKSVDGNEEQEEQKPVIKGWIKIPKVGKAAWVRKYGNIIGNTLYIYDQEPVASLQPTTSFLLSDFDLSLTLYTSVPSSELPSTLESELPYVFKFELCSPKRDVTSYPILTSSFEEKQAWLAALEKFASLSPSSPESDDQLRGSISAETIISLRSAAPLDVNTMVLINKNTALIGANEGLFSFERSDGSSVMKFRARIDGFASVHQILFIKSINLAIFIAGKENLVFQNDLRTLTTVAEASQIVKPSLTPKTIDPLFSCHLVDASHHSDKKLFLCAAASDRISILVWNSEKGTFVVCRQFSTQEPCSCFLFTQRALIVGAERYYKIDLKNFNIEEFLDETDTSLAYAIYGSTQTSSFPVSIIQVSKPGNHEEYVLIFYEFAIFVDSRGRRTREVDLKFTRLPLGILFQHPHLFVLHQNCVEVIEIRAESYTRVRGMSLDSDSECSAIVRTSSKKLSKPRFIGKSGDSTAIYVVTSSEEQMDILSLSADFPDDPNASFFSSVSSPFAESGIEEDKMDATSMKSDVSESSNSSFKRTKVPNFMRVSKRSKKAI